MDAIKTRKTFLSYSRVNKDFALRLAKELKAEGFNLWLDQLDIPAGVRWDREVERALEESEIFMIILTPASIDSENVLDEIGYAIDTGKRLLPVLLEKCTVPFRLRRFQYVDFTDKGFDDGVESAKELLRSLVAQSTLPGVRTHGQTERKEQNGLDHLSVQRAEETANAVAAEKAEVERLAKHKPDEKLATRADAERGAKQEVEHRTPEKATSMEIWPVQMKAETSSATHQKKPASKGVVIGVFSIAAVVVLAVAGIGFRYIFNSSTPAPKEPVTPTISTSQPVKTATSRPKPTSTSRPTATPNLAATQKVLHAAATAQLAESMAAKASQWDLKISEKFDNSHNPYGWFLGTDMSEYGKSEAKITNGKYIWSYDAYQGVFSRSWVYTISLSDFYLTVNAQETSGCDTCGVGIVFRNSTGNDYYFFGIYPEQKQFGFYLYKGEWTTLIDRTAASYIHSEGANKLSLLARGSHFMFFINDQFAAQATDDTLPNGPMGLGIELNANSEGKFEFDDVMLRVP